MRIRLAIPDRHVTPDVLEAALEATTRANAQMMASGEAPTFSEALSKGLKWKPEPYIDGEHFDLAATAAGRGWGDCDDLSPMLCGELRASGADPGCACVVRRSGPNRWHVVVRASDGSILDPSRMAGMKGRDDGTVNAAIVGSMALPGDHAIALLPIDGGRWAARCDVPWPESDTHLAGLARSRDPNRALMRAIEGATLCGACVGSDISEAQELVEGLWGEGEVGSLWGSLKKLAKKAASAALPLAASMVPGGSVALDVADKIYNAASEAEAKGPAGVTRGGGVLAASAAATAPALMRERGMITRTLGSGTITWNPRQPGPLIVRF